MVARVAAEQLRLEDQLQKFPVDLDFDYEIAKKLYRMLQNNQNGVFKKSIPDMYRSAYNVSLPEHWAQIILENNEKLFIIENNVAQIIYAIADDSSESGSVTSESDECSQQTLLPELELPWNEENWNLYVINPLKTDQIYVRLIGSDWSEKLDALLDEIEMSFLQSSPMSAPEVKSDKIYLCSLNDCWMRVKVIDTAEMEANCFMIDQGDFEQISFDKLFVCPIEFLRLPAQSFIVSLYGLEDLAENPQSFQYLEEIRWRSLIGKITSAKTDFDENQRISLELYDTSGAEDVNLNETIMGKILECSPKPSLNLKALNNVRITCIADYIYAQQSQSFDYIQGLISNLVKSSCFNKDKLLDHQGLYLETSSKLNRFYLVFDEKRNAWFRGQIDSVVSDKKIYRMTFVDTGIVENVNLKNIYRLDKISVALTLYPAQAIKFKLHKVEMNENVKNRLRALLPFNKEAMVSN